MPADPSLADVWRRFVEYDVYSVKEQTRQRFWQNGALGLTIAGSILAAFADQFKPLAGASPPSPHTFGTVVAVVAGLLLAISAAIGRQFLLSKDANNWVVARSVAEALKSEAFRYAARIAPYDDADPRKAAMALIERQVEIETPGANLQRPQVDAAAAVKDMPTMPLTASEYARVRAEEQRDWYRRRSNDHKRQRGWWEGIATVLGFSAIVIGGLQLVIDAPVVAAWVAVVGAVTAAIAAHVAAQRMRTIETSYISAATLLDQRLSRWKAAGSPETDPERTTLVSTCESVMRSENGGWMAEWLDTNKPVPPSGSMPNPA